MMTMMTMMMKTKGTFIALLAFLFYALPAFSAQTIAEKKAGASEPNQEMTQEMKTRLLKVNRDLRNAEQELTQLYYKVGELYLQKAPAETYKELLEKINQVRERIVSIQNHWREISINGPHSEEYALWHQPETTIGQLVMDYGSHDYVYLLNSEITSIKLSVDSNLLIPRASWEEMLDLILVQNGIGYRQLNPFLRQLYFLSENKAGLKLITNKRQDLDLFPVARICFVLTPEPAEVRRAWLFLDKFVNPNSTVLQQVGRDILIVGQVAEVQDLLKLYDFIAANKGEKEYRIFPVTRVDAEEMAKILAAIFDQVSGGNTGGGTQSRGPEPKSSGRHRPPVHNEGAGTSDSNGLRVIALSHVAHALFLVGTKEEIKKAEQIIRQVENQVGEAREKVIFWYTVKNSDPEELADVLFRVYMLMVQKRG